MTSSLFLCVLACLLCCYVAQPADISTLLSQLADDVAKQQITSGENAGLYKVKVYIHVPPNMASKYVTHGYDDNVFMTMWTVVVLLEASLYSGIPFITPQQLNSAIAGFEKGKDRNAAGDTSVMIFYEQTYNATSDWWQCLRPYDTRLKFPSEDDIRQHLHDQGVADADILARVATIMAPTITDNDTPADFDSTFVHVGLGALLAEMKDSFPTGYALWMESNQNLSSTTETLKRFAYRPFAANNPNNAMDPKAYYVVRYFLEEVTSRHEDVAIVPTYVFNQDAAMELYRQGKPVVFTMNDLDLGVCVDTIYGITAAILFDILPPEILDDSDLQMIYLNSTSYILYQMRTNFSGRVDLVFLYYRSLSQFYWFTSRILSLLERVQLHRELPHPSVAVVYNIMKDILRGQVTQELLNQAKPSLTSDQIYFDNIGVEVEERDVMQDRVANTAMTTLSLLNIWSVFNINNKTTSWINSVMYAVFSTLGHQKKPAATIYAYSELPIARPLLKHSVVGSILLSGPNCSLGYFPFQPVLHNWFNKGRDTPVVVQQTIAAACKWLAENSVSDEYQHRNTFFSAIVIPLDLPFWYPTNRMEFLNGTKFSDDCDFPEELFVGVVEGFIPEVEYQAMLNRTHFGVKTPTEFMNIEDSFYKYWSCEAITYATTLLALSQYDAIIQNT